MMALAGVDGLDCDPRKFFFTVRHPTTRNPYGESLLSRLWFPVTWRREGWAMWLKFLETFGSPIVTAQITGSPEAFKTGLASIGFQSAIVWNGPPTDKINTLSSPQSGEFERLETALIKRIQKLILGQTLTSDVGDSGSYAAAKVHENVMHTKTYADCRLAMGTVQRIVDALAGLNGLQAPQFILADDTGLESERAVRDAALLPVLTASGLKLTPDYFVDRYDFRETDLMDAPAARADHRRGTRRGTGSGG
jgi:phage gp29-like protein